MYVVWTEILFCHKCVKSQLYHILVNDSTDNEAETDEFVDCMDYMEELEAAHKKERMRERIILERREGVFHFIINWFQIPLTHSLHTSQSLADVSCHN